MPPEQPGEDDRGRDASGSTMSSAIVAATFSEMKAPTKFRSAASATATFGFRAFVAIEVAMALAVS